MKKEIAQLVLNSLVNNSTMVERAALMQERWGNVDLNEVATPIIKRVLIDAEDIQNFLNEKYPGIKISQVHVEVSAQKFEPVLSFRDDYPDLWIPKSSDYWWNGNYSLEEKEGWYKLRKDWNCRTIKFEELGIPKELYHIEWL